MAEEAKEQTAAAADTAAAPEAKPDPAAQETKKAETAVKAVLTEKTLGNTDASGATQNVPDVKFFGNGDTFQLICKASSQKEGWMKSTKAMEVMGAGCVVQVTTQQKNIDGTYSIAEALCFVPGVRIEEVYAAEDSKKVAGRRLVQY